MRAVDERGTVWRQPVIEFDGFGTAKHASVNADMRVLDIVDEPFDPVLGGICVTGLDEMPTRVDLVCSLYPVPRVGDEVCCGH